VARKKEMEVPKGFFEKLWSFVSFLPYFFLLLLLGVTKGMNLLFFLLSIHKNGDVSFAY
jgi:hypothetical protein